MILPILLRLPLSTGFASVLSSTQHPVGLSIHDSQTDGRSIAIVACPPYLDTCFGTLFFVHLPDLHCNRQWCPMSAFILLFAVSFRLRAWGELVALCLLRVAIYTQCWVCIQDDALHHGNMVSMKRLYRLVTCTGNQKLFAFFLNFWYSEGLPKNAVSSKTLRLYLHEAIFSKDIAIMIPRYNICYIALP